MRRVRCVAAALYAMACLSVGSGCFLFTKRPAPPASTTALPTDPAPPAEGRLLLHTRVLDQPAGSDYLNRGVWADTTDPLPHELSALLAANGLKVGLLSGLIPADFERLATSETSTVQAKLSAVRGGEPKEVGVCGSPEACAVEAVAKVGARPRVYEFDTAECLFVLTASAPENGTVRVRCEPRVRYGDKRGWWKPNDEGTGFERHDHRPDARFPELAWELTLAPRDVLVIGATAEPDGKLGHTFFYASEANRRRQRLFALQVGAAEADRTPRPTGSVAALVR